MVVICDIHKLSDEPFPEGISGRTSPSILNDPYSPTSILIRPQRTSPNSEEDWPDDPKTMPRSSRGLLVEAGALQPPSAKSYMIAFSNGPRAILQR